MITPRAVLSAAAEGFHGPEGREIILRAFDNIERFRHLEAIAPGYREIIAALADLAGAAEAERLKGQWGAR